MERVVVYGLVVVCVCMLFALSGPSAERLISGDSGSSTSTPVPVAVNNFPAVQTVQGNVAVVKMVNVTGSVAVTNLPAVQNVAGSVEVSNLPLDADGNLKISSAPSSARPGPTFIGITQATFLDAGVDGVGVLTLNRACAAEFPGTRVCQLAEILLDTIPPPPEWPGLVRITTAENSMYGGKLGGPSACLRSTGLALDCSYAPDGPGPWPAACCGY